MLGATRPLRTNGQIILIFMWLGLAQKNKFKTFQKVLDCVLDTKQDPELLTDGGLRSTSRFVVYWY